MIYLWILLVIPYVYCWRKVAWYLIMDINSGSYEHIDGTDFVFGIMIGAIISIVFPVIVPLLILHRLLNGKGDIAWWLIAPKDITQQRREEVMARRIRKLEAELLDKREPRRLY